MPDKGSKSHRQKNRGKNAKFGSSRELVLATEGQNYARITVVLGSGRFRVTSCDDNVSRLGILRGSLSRNRGRVGCGDLVLYATRDFQADKVDIIHVYLNDEVKMLEKRKIQVQIRDPQFNSSQEGNVEPEEVFVFENI